MIKQICIRTCFLLLFSFVIINCAFGTPVKAEKEDDSTADMTELMADINVATTDTLGQKAYNEHLKTQIATEEYYRESLIHRRNTFLWQYNSSKIIFYVVIFIVICGTIYSGIQFYMSLYETKQDTKTEMEFSLTSIKVTSSLIGILILIISIAFFYMYLIYVYPIDQMKVDTKESGPAGKTEQTSKNGAK